MYKAPTVLILASLLTGATLTISLLLDRQPATAQQPEPEADTAGVVESRNRLESNLRWKELAQESFASMGQPPGMDSAFSFHCLVAVELVDTSLAVETANEIEVLITDDRVRVAGAEFTMVRDTSVALLVLPRMRTVYLFHGGGASALESGADPTALFAVRDSLFARSSVIECAQERADDGTSLRRIVLSPDPTMRRLSNVNEFTLWLDTASGSIRRISLTPYRPEYYRRISWTFDDMRRLPRPQEFNEPVEREVLDSRGRLLPEYARYTLDDNRPIAQSSTR